MELQQTAYLAGQLMEQHGLFETGWKFVFDNSKRRYGQCRHRSKQIGVSKHLSLLNDEASVRDVILHEIAHALVGIGHGHDTIWKAKAREIGCDGQRCYDSKTTTLVEGKYIAVCCGCGRKHSKHRKTNKNHSCGYCSGGSYNESFKLNFELNRIYQL